MGYIGGPDPRLLLQQPDLHAYMVRPFPEFFALNTPRGDPGDSAQGGGVPSGGPGAPVDGAPGGPLPGQELPAGQTDRQGDAQVRGAQAGTYGGVLQRHSRRMRLDAPRLLIKQILHLHVRLPEQDPSPCNSVRRCQHPLSSP